MSRNGGFDPPSAGVGCPALRRQAGKGVMRMSPKMTRYRVTAYEEEIPCDLAGFRSWEFSNGSTTGEDFRIFARQFRNYIKGELPEGASMQGFSVGHYDVSGFIERGGRFVYFSVSDVRHFPGNWYKEILVRTAKSDKDYTGGPNNHTTLESFREDVNRLLG